MNTQPTESNLSGLTGIPKGNTKTILIALYQNYHKIPPNPDQQKVVATLIALDCAMAKTAHQLMKTLNPITDLRDDALTAISKINDADNQTYRFNERVNPLVQKITELSEERKKLKQAYESLLKSQQAILTSLKQDAASSADNTPAMIRAAQEDFIKLNKNTQNHFDDVEKTATTTIALYREAYHLLSNKTGVKTPPADARHLLNP